jgi:hypothetical protein
VVVVLGDVEFVLAGAAAVGGRATGAAGGLSARLKLAARRVSVNAHSDRRIAGMGASGKRVLVGLDDFNDL